MISFTETAEKRMYMLCALNSVSAIRLSVIGGGCAGYRYRWELCDVTTPDDFVVPILTTAIKQYTFAIDKSSMVLLRGSLIDYIDDPFDSHWDIQNPAATSSCGCRDSFFIQQGEYNG